MPQPGAMYSDNCVGVLSSTVKLQPGEVLEFCYTLGATDDRQDIAPQIADAFSAEVRDHALEKLHATWDDYRSCLAGRHPLHGYEHHAEYLARLCSQNHL